MPNPDLPTDADRSLRPVKGAILAAAALALTLVAGCSPGPEVREAAASKGPTDPPKITADASPPSAQTDRAADTRPAVSGPPRSERRTCFLAVDGQMELNGPCLVFPMGDGGYTLNAWSEGKPEDSHFAVVAARPDGTADASWNADPDDDRAGDPLGAVSRSGNCWINARARICAT